MGSSPDLTTLVDNIFCPEGLLPQQYGFEYREQHQYALAVSHWLTRDGVASDTAANSAPVAMLEGETGIGKSLAYLLPLAIQLSRRGQRALISTYTVHLIQQLGRDRKIIDGMLDHLGLSPIKVCNRLGRAQYVSASKVLELAENTDDKTDRNALLQPFSYLIADEADRLPAAAESLYRLRSSPQRIASLCHDLKESCGLPVQQVNKACTALKEMQTVMDEAGGLYRDQSCLISRDLPASLGGQYTTAVKRSLAALKPLVESIQPSIEASFNKINTLKGFYQSLNSILTDEYQPSCLAWSPVNRIASVAIDNPFAGLAFSRWVRGIKDRQPPVSVMLTSGTLGISTQQGIARFAPLRSSLGINEGDVTSYGNYAPGHYGEIRFVLAGEVASSFVGSKENDDEQAACNEQWLTFAARMPEAAINEGHTASPTLCLCPSFAEVTELQALVNHSKVGFHLKGSRLDELIEQLQTGELIAIVTPSAWEGVSIRARDGSRLLRNIMVTRLPIQPPSRVTENAFAARYISNGHSRDEAKKVLFVRDRGLRKLRQGLIGRGIRASQDSVTAWIAAPASARTGATDSPESSRSDFSATTNKQNTSRPMANEPPRSRQFDLFKDGKAASRSPAPTTRKSQEKAFTGNGYGQRATGNGQREASFRLPTIEPVNPPTHRSHPPCCIVV